MRLGDRQDGIHVCHLPEQVDRDDCLGLRRDGRLEQLRIHVVGLLIDVDEDRGRPTVADGLCRGDEGGRDGDHLIAWPDAEGEKRQPQRVCAVGDTDRNLGVTVGRKLVPRSGRQSDLPQRLPCRSPQRSMPGTPPDAEDGATLDRGMERWPWRWWIHAVWGRSGLAEKVGWRTRWVEVGTATAIARSAR